MCLASVSRVATPGRSSSNVPRWGVAKRDQWCSVAEPSIGLTIYFQKKENMFLKNNTKQTEKVQLHIIKREKELTVSSISCIRWKGKKNMYIYKEEFLSFHILKQEKSKIVSSTRFLICKTAAQTNHLPIFCFKTAQDRKQINAVLQF